MYPVIPAFELSLLDPSLSDLIINVMEIGIDSCGEFQRKDLKPGDKPEASFAVTEPLVTAYEFCNLQGLWMAKA